MCIRDRTHLIAKSKIYSAKFQQKRHLSIHTGAKLYSCRHCSDVDMKVWSRMFAVVVQSVFTQQLIWQIISMCILTTNSFVVVYVVKTSNINVMFQSTSGNVLITLKFVIVNSYILFSLVWLQPSWKMGVGRVVVVLKLGIPRRLNEPWTQREQELKLL